MRTVVKKEKRQHIRIPLISEVCTWFDTQGLAWEDKLLDISNGGVFIKSDKQPKPRDNIVLKFILPGDLGTLNLRGKVIRKRWAVKKSSKLDKGFAVQFIDNKATLLKILDAYCIYLRNRQIIAISKRIVEEFFGTKPSPDGAH